MLKIGDSPRCTVCGDPTIRTWNGVYTALRDTGKYLLARYDDGSRDTCKFQIRCVVSAGFKTDDRQEALYVDWCGVSVHQHASKKADESNGPQTRNSQFFRRYMIGQRLDYFGATGTGMKRWKARYNTVDDPLYFPRADEDLEQTPWTKDGKKRVPDPACSANGTPTYSIYIDRANNTIKLRSFCCGWAVDFWPAGGDTCVSVYADPSNAVVRGAGDKMEGLCGGKIGGPKADDWSTCGLPRTTLRANQEASMVAMEASCHEEDNESSGYPGGTRLDSIGN